MLEFALGWAAGTFAPPAFGLGLRGGKGEAARPDKGERRRVDGYTDLWEFECDRHGEYDVWGKDWGDEDPMDRPPWLGNATFEPADVRSTRCPSCLVVGSPKGPRLGLA